jgi:GNAT superfamily N-acetyltransferase
VFARAHYRRQGVAKALIRAAVDFADSRGAAALEAYPITTSAAIDEELHVGTIASYLEAGFLEVSRPTKRRAVVRLDF